MYSLLQVERALVPVTFCTQGKCSRPELPWRLSNELQPIDALLVLEGLRLDAVSG